MSLIKVRKRVTLDADVVDFLDSEPAGFSTTVNQILHDEVDRRAQQERVDETFGRVEVSLDAQDPERVAYFKGLFPGTSGA